MGLQPGEVGQEGEYVCLPRAGMDIIGPAVFPGMLRYEGGVDTPQDDGNIGVMLPDRGNGSLHSLVPIRHQGGHQHRGRLLGQAGQSVVYLGQTQTVAAVASGQALKRRGRGQSLFGPAAPGTVAARRTTGAVKHRHLITRGPQDSGQIEQA